MAAPIVSMFVKYRPLFSQCLRVYKQSRGTVLGRNVLTRKWEPRQLLPTTFTHLQCVGHQSTDSSSSRVTEDENQNESYPEDNQFSSCEEDPYAEEVEVCLLCKANVPISYKNPKLLSQFVSPNTGRIFGQHITRLCEKQQKRIEKAITRSRKYGYMPVMYRDTIFLKDPNIFDVKYTGSADIGGHIRLPGADATGEGRPITLTAHKKSDKQMKSRKRDKVKLTKAEKRRGVKNKNKS